jgi:hypothetical protein
MGPSDCCSMEGKHGTLSGARSTMQNHEVISCKKAIDRRTIILHYHIEGVKFAVIYMQGHHLHLFHFNLKYAIYLAKNCL